MTTNLLAMPLVQITFQVCNNEDWIDSIVYVVGTDPTNLTTQLDLTGIDFQMEIRRAPTDNEVILAATTDDQRISVGAQPNFGYLIIHIPESEMSTKAAGTYVGDIVGIEYDPVTGAAKYARTVILLTLTIVEGITTWPSPV